MQKGLRQWNGRRISYEQPSDTKLSAEQHWRSELDDAWDVLGEEPPERGNSRSDETLWRGWRFLSGGVPRPPADSGKYGKQAAVKLSDPGKMIFTVSGDDGILRKESVDAVSKRDPIKGRFIMKKAILKIEAEASRAAIGMVKGPLDKIAVTMGDVYARVIKDATASGAEKLRKSGALGISAVEELNERTEEDADGNFCEGGEKQRTITAERRNAEAAAKAERRERGKEDQEEQMELKRLQSKSRKRFVEQRVMGKVLLQRIEAPRYSKAAPPPHTRNDDSDGGPSIPALADTGQMTVGGGFQHDGQAQGGSNAEQRTQEVGLRTHMLSTIRNYFNSSDKTILPPDVLRDMMQAGDSPDPDPAELSEALEQLISDGIVRLTSAGIACVPGASLEDFNEDSIRDYVLSMLKACVMSNIGNGDGRCVCSLEKFGAYVRQEAHLTVQLSLESTMQSLQDDGLIEIDEIVIRPTGALLEQASWASSLAAPMAYRRGLLQSEKPPPSVCPTAD